MNDPYKTKLPSLLMVAGLSLAVWSPASQACSVEPFIGSVCAMAIPPARYPTIGNMYMLAAGQMLPINQYSALYALTGTTYGSSGNNMFALPDLRGRVIVGYNPAQLGNIPAMQPGTKGGDPVIKLAAAQLPAGGVQLNMPVTLTGVTASMSGLSATANLSGLVLSGAASGLTVKVAQNASGVGTPSGNYLGKSNGNAGNIYTASAPDATLNAGTIGGTLSFTVNPNTTAPVNFTGTPAVTLSGNPTISGTTGLGTGADVPVMQPYLVIPYYIAVLGNYPPMD